LQGLDPPVVYELLAVHCLQARGFEGIGAPLPIQFRDLVGRADGRRRVAMAIQAKTHAQRLGVPHFLHLIHPPMAGHATDAAGDMDRVVKIDVIGHLVNLHPGNGRIVRGAVADDLQARIVLQHLIVAVHAGGRARQVGKPGFFDPVMAIAAIQAELAGMDPMRKRHRLDRLVADAVVFGREINRHARRHAAAGQPAQNGEHQRQTVCPFRKNHCLLKIKNTTE